MANDPFTYTPYPVSPGYDQLQAMMGVAPYSAPPFDFGTSQPMTWGPAVGQPLSNPNPYAQAFGTGATTQQFQGGSQMAPPRNPNQPVNPYRPGPNYNPDVPSPGVPGYGFATPNGMTTYGAVPSSYGAPAAASSGTPSYGTGNSLPGLNPGASAGVSEATYGAIPYFGTNYQRGLESMGLNTLSGAPAAELMSSLGNRAFAGYLSNLFQGNANPENTTPNIASFLNGGYGGGAPGLGGNTALGAVIKNLLSLHDNDPTAFASNPGAAGLQMLLDNPSQALNYVSGLLSPAGMQGYMQKYLQAAASQMAAQGGAQGPLDYARAILNLIPGAR